MKTSEIRSVLSRRYNNVKFSRKLNLWTMTDPCKSTCLSRKKQIVMRAEWAEKEAADMIAFRAE